MDVTVRVFAAFADALGASQRIVSVTEPATVGALRSALVQLSSKLPPRPLIAVNCVYAEDDLVLHPTDEVALIPPVAGG